MDQEIIKKEPCSTCGSVTYEWAAIPTTEAGELIAKKPDACSNCHSLDEQHNLIPKGKPVLN